MEPVIELDGVRVFHGDCRDVLAALPDNSVDSIVTDPPYELGFMGKSWDASGIAYNSDVWEQCLRVLKPGGHLLAFGGTRTWHRLAVAVEDAGFEVRDSIAWMYGSGFPKSLDVSKAIDKSLGVEREKIRTRITPRSTAGKGATNNDLDARPWLTKAREQGFHEHAGSEPATSEAEKWQGWGTALKPAFEPIVVARKPLRAEIAVRAIIENELKKRGETDILWRRLASDATKQSHSKHSGSTKPLATAGTFVKTASEQETQSTDGTSPNSIRLLRDDSQSEIRDDSGNLQEKPKQNLGNKSSTHTEASVPVAAKKPNNSSPSTTLKAEELDTESAHTARSGQSLGETDSLTVIESFAGIATGLPGETASVLINKLSDGSFQWPDGLPEVFKTGNTVAETVLEWGTGGLNIDGSRIGSESTVRNSHAGTNGEGWGMGKSESVNGSTQGRWPANVILDEVTAGLLDEQSGVSKSPVSYARTTDVRGSIYRDGIGAVGAGEISNGFGDSGGASRFFYCAKASKRDRNEGLNLCQCDKLGAWENEDQTAPPQADTGQSTPKGIGASGTPNNGDSEWNTSSSGNSTTANSKTGNKSTTSTGTSSTTESTTLSPLIASPTNDFTQDVSSEMGSGGSRVNSAASQSPLELNTGTSARKDGLSTGDADPVTSELWSGQNNVGSHQCAKCLGIIGGHPTVKPTALMRYLLKLVTPPGGTVLDPFTGSGSTGKAAILEGFDFVGVELTDDYLPIIEGRLKWALENQDEGTLF